MLKYKDQYLITQYRDGAIAELDLAKAENKRQDPKLSILTEIVDVTWEDGWPHFSFTVKNTGKRCYTYYDWLIALDTPENRQLILDTKEQQEFIRKEEKKLSSIIKKIELIVKPQMDDFPFG